ncbi:MAG: OsmC family peroxiredoxin [Rhodanobacteraceae bacterium]|nr:MAG: OsmC family peroxiredoxin [Rhodanobacteraceae bacterium]
MQEYPHHYRASATGRIQGAVRIASPQLPSLETAPPPEYGGDPGYWSPETLLVAAVADCFVLSFRAVARGSGLAWDELACDVEGTLERVDRVTRFTGFDLSARLRIADPDSRDKAMRCLEKAEQVCLITNSLTGGTTLHCQIDTAPPA